MEDLPAKASSVTPEPAIIVPGNKGASKIAPAVPSIEEVQNFQVRAADAKHAAEEEGPPSLQRGLRGPKPRG